MEFERVLVFCAHPDDEVLGVGATMAKLSTQGVEVTVVGFTSGETGYFRDEMKNGFGELRISEAREVDKILGIRNRIMLNIPCQGVVNDITTYQKCVEIIRKYRPNAIFTHFRQDKHRDHRAVSQIVDEARWKSTEKCLSDLGEPWYTPHLYYYEIRVLFPHPSIVIDVTETMEKKIEAMKAYQTQIDFFHTDIIDFIEGLGRCRGFFLEGLGQQRDSLKRGTRYAESFLQSTLMPTLL